MGTQPNWVVQPHGPLVTHSDNLWSVEGTIGMPTGPLSRRMTLARLGNGALVIFSAIALSEDEMRQVERLGRPAYLVVPNAFHREDAPGWKARYPQMRVVTPQGARAAVEELMGVDACGDIFDDPSVRFLTVPGTQDAESALLVSSQDGKTLVVNDLIGNVRNARGLMKLALSLMGFAGRKPQVPRMFVARVVKDRTEVAAQFRQWAVVPDLRRIVVSHGDIIERDAGAVLSGLADRLA